MPLAAPASQLSCARASGTRSTFYACCRSSSSASREVRGARRRSGSGSPNNAPSSSIKPPSHRSSHPVRRVISLSASAMNSSPLYLGIDMGTSGGRAMVIDDAGTVVASAKKAYPPLPPETSSSPRDWAETWACALDDLLESLAKSPSSPSGVLPRVASAAVAGTSASMLLVDAGVEGEEEGENESSSSVGAPLAPVRLYCDAASPAAVAATAALAPAGHQAAAPTSALSKLIDWWVGGEIEGRNETEEEKEKVKVNPVVVSAADWLTARLGRVAPRSSSSSPSSSTPSSRARDGQFLRSRLFVTDDNNQLKAGWDPGSRSYEPWLRQHPAAARLAPRVVRPGDATGCEVARGKNAPSSSPPGAPPSPPGAPPPYLPAGCLLAGGTTDSIAATLAAGVRSTPGDAVTSLGSSLAIKLVSERRIDDGARGIYSHLIPGDDGEGGSVWLVGGSSNAGCAVFRLEFGSDDSVLERLTAEIEREDGDEGESTRLDYYPLPRRGERFPVCDPNKEPILGPRPASDAVHLKAILEGITEIERAGFAALEELGAPKPKRVLTAGGGAKNAVWTRMRAKALSPAVVSAAEEGEAAYGAALLARRAVTGKW